MTSDDTNKGSRSRNLFTFDRVALILGFIVDSITLGAIILSVDLPDLAPKLPRFVSPELAAVVWALTTYTYLAFLHSYWEDNRETKVYSHRFIGFLGVDLIARFRNPLLLFPGLLLTIISTWALYTWSTMYAAIAFLGVVLFVVMLARFSVIDLSLGHGPIWDYRATILNKIDKDWQFFEGALQSKLAKQQWLEYTDLEDLVCAWNGPDVTSYLDYVFSKYAIQHADEAAYSRVHLRGSGIACSGGQKVIVNLETLDRQKYYLEREAPQSPSPE